MSWSKADNWEVEFNDTFSPETIVGVQEAVYLSSSTAPAPPSCEREAYKRRRLGEPAKGVMSAWELIGAAHNEAALFVHERILPCVSWRSDIAPEFEHCTNTTGCVLGDSGVVSCYFSHENRPDVEFFDRLDECARMCTYLRSNNVNNNKGVKHLFLSCDLNLQLSANVEGITGGEIHALPNKQLESREIAFLQFLRDFDLCV